MSDEVEDFKPVWISALAFNKADPEYHDPERATFLAAVRRYETTYPRCAAPARALWLGLTTQKARREGTNASAERRKQARESNGIAIAERCILFRRTGQHSHLSDMQLACQAAKDLKIERKKPDKNGSTKLSAKHAWDLAKEGLGKGANPSRVMEAAKRRTVHSPKSIFDGSKELP